MKLWDFALDYYRRAGVAPACLILQDVGGVDVNVLIYLLWRAAARGEAVPDTAAAEADAVVAAWREEIVEPLRSLRRRLKSGPPPAPCSASEALRGRIKAAEIEAEHIELDMLEGLVDAVTISPVTDRQAEARRILDRLVAHYGADRSTELQQPIEALLRAL